MIAVADGHPRDLVPAHPGPGAVPPDSVPASSDAMGELDQPAQIASAVINLVRLYTGIKAKVTTGPEGDLSPLFLLVKLAHHGPRRASDLAEQMCADPSTVSRQVASLVRSGLVERRADPHDGRASILVPTELGLRAVEQHARRRGATVAPVIEDWPQRDRDDFLRLVRKYAAGVEEHREEIISVLTAASTAASTTASTTASTAVSTAASPTASTTGASTAGMQPADPARGSSITTTKGS